MTAPNENSPVQDACKWTCSFKFGYMRALSDMGLSVMYA